MPKTYQLASQLHVKLDGAPLQPEVMEMVDSMTVDQHSHLPNMFTLRVHDPQMELLNKGIFDLTREVEISADTAEGKKITLIKGEITALEPEFREGMILELVVRGYDKSHRLYREPHSKAFLNVKDSDMASTIAGKAGLSPVVDKTTTIYAHVYQHNQTDLEFLMQRAWRIGFECFVDDGKLHFRKPSPNGSGPTLTWGEDLLSFRPRMTVAEQVDEVIVRGWNVKTQAPIVGKASSGALYPKIDKAKKQPQDEDQALGAARRVIVNHPVVDQAEANTLAAARMDEISGAFIEAEGVALRRPDIRAGATVKLKALGSRFDGTYMVTSATHHYSPRGLETTFSVRGTRTGLLSEQIAHQEPATTWPGAVIAVVTNTDDPENWGRVKLKFPWLSEDAESDWARVVGIGAGNETGLFVLPHVGDEVLVIFLHGDFSQPFVLGGLWNGKEAPPKEAAKAPKGEKPFVRTWHSKKGHRIVMFDNADNRIEIVSAGDRQVIIDDKEKKIIVKTQGVTITLEDRKLEIKSDGEVSVKSSSNLKLEASGSIDIKASGNVNIKGSTINLN